MELQIYVRDGIVVIAATKRGYAPFPIAYLAPDQADAYAVTLKEMAATARRRGEIVQQLKAGA